MSRNDSTPLRTGYAPAGYFALKPGTAVQVKHCANGYPLPPGLESGDRVKILSFDHGYYGVEKIDGGEKFTVFMANIGVRLLEEKSSATANRRSHNGLSTL